MNQYSKNCPRHNGMTNQAACRIHPAPSYCHYWQWHITTLWSVLAPLKVSKLPSMANNIKLPILYQTAHLSFIRIPSLIWCNTCLTTQYITRIMYKVHGFACYIVLRNLLTLPISVRTNLLVTEHLFVCPSRVMQLWRIWVYAADSRYIAV